MEYKFRAGVGRRDITPEVGCMLQGYTPWRPSTSIHDHLHVTAFAVEVNGVRALMVSLDLCTCRGKVSIDLRKAMAEAANVPFDNIILSPIHTHSGPGMATNDDGSAKDPAYAYGLLLPMAVEAAKEAADTLQDAQMGVGVTMSNVAVNRRELTEDGRVELGQDELGLYDPRMTVVSFRSAETKKTISNMVFYGCHNTGCGRNGEISRDWCGVMIDRMDKETGGITAFFNGCQGDCGPRLSNGKTTGNLQLALELGGIAGIDGMRAWRSIREWRDEIELRSVFGVIELPYGELPTAEYLDRRIAEFTEPEKLHDEPLIEYRGLLKQKEFLSSDKVNETVKEIPTAILAIGPVAFVPIPFETFSAITMRIIRHSPFPYTVCISNGNGSNGYFPSQDQLCMGGYEVMGFKVNAAHPLVDNADQYMITGCLKLLRQLFEESEE